MSIFNEIGLAIGKGTGEIGAKAKVIRESSKLNVMAGEEEKKLVSYYQSIGQIYADIHKNDYEPIFAELMTMVEESQNNLMDYRRQSEELKQIRNCPVCGRPITEDSQFCSFCGNRIDNNIGLNSRNVISQITCYRCGKILDTDAKFCENCGLPVEETLKKIKEQTANLPVTYEEVELGKGVERQGQIELGRNVKLPEQAKLKKEYVTSDKQENQISDIPSPLICSVCGEEVEDGAAFCGNCGIRI